MASSRLVPTSSLRQQGAVLYVALIMLILLALIGIVGMQVTGLQERMAANYRNVNIAFQNAEASARQIETTIQSTIFGGASAFVSDQEVCAPIFDPLTWADAKTAAAATYTRRVDKCFAASSLIIGAKLNEETGNIYEVTALDSDNPSNATASAVIDTIFIP